MFKHNYLKVAITSPKVKLGSPMDNAHEIVDILSKTLDASIVLFPELCLTGSSIGDWFYNDEILKQQECALDYILNYSDERVIIIGGVYQYLENLYDVAFVVQDGIIIGIVPRFTLDSELNRNFINNYELLDNYIEVEYLGQIIPFGNLKFINSLYNISFGIEIGNDLGKLTDAQIIFNLNSSSYYLNKDHDYKKLVDATSLLKLCSYVLTTINASETASDMMYNGQMIASTLGENIINKSSLSFASQYEFVDIDIEHIKFERMKNHFKQVNDDFYVEFNLEESDNYILSNSIDKEPFIFKSDLEKEEVIDVLCTSLYHRLNHIGISKVVIGVSGGLDSTLALLVAHRAFKQYGIPTSNILAYSMPCLGTGSKSQQIALDLMNGLEVKGTVLPIGEEVKSHFNLINHDINEKNTTYENVQARYRTLVLMNVSNSERGIVLGTGDMSEIALGWSTFNGDQMSMYNVNAGLPKTSIKSLVKYFAKIYPNLAFVLTDVVNATITPELVSSNQATEDIIGKYEINDFILHQVFSNGSSKDRMIFLLESLFNLDFEIANKYYDSFLRRFKQNQFKRIASPEGVRIFKLSLSPHGAFKFSGDLK